jgi:mannose-1-phosphate guanylyltransferase
MKAMILAAGAGTRVRPLTYMVPKPMIPLLGRPLMEFLVAHLRSHGFDQIVVNTSYMAPQIEAYFRDGHRFGVEMAYSFEGTIGDDGKVDTRRFGSAGGMRRVQDFSGFFDDTFIVICGDALIDVDLTKAVAEHRAAGAIASLIATLVPHHDVSSYGIVVIDANGRIGSFQEKPSPEAALSRMANTGIYIFEPEVFDFIPRDRSFDIGSELFPALIAAGAPFYAMDMPFEWVDIGQTPDYYYATMKLLRGELKTARVPGREIVPGIHAGINVSLPTSPEDRARLRGPIWIGGSTVIKPGATIIGPAAIGAGSIVEAGAHIERSIVWEYTRVSGLATLRDQIVCGPYCVTSEGVTVWIDEAALRWVVDDARRAKPVQDEHGIADFVAQQL